MGLRADRAGEWTHKAIEIGSDGNGGLQDNLTKQAYTASVNGNGVNFSADGGKTSSTGVFDNTTNKQNTFQDAGFANGGALSGFSFTLTNSKMEANQTEAGTFSFAGTPEQAGSALERVGFQYMHGIGTNMEFNEYRTFGHGITGANAGHFNIQMIQTNPRESLPTTVGNMHFGEHSPIGLGLIPHGGWEAWQ